MRTMSLSPTDAVLERSGRCAEALAISRAEYIRRAIQAMNRETEARLRAARLANASRKVRDESMRVNADFEATDHDPDA